LLKIYEQLKELFFKISHFSTDEQKDFWLTCILKPLMLRIRILCTALTGRRIRSHFIISNQKFRLWMLSWEFLIISAISFKSSDLQSFRTINAVINYIKSTKRKTEFRSISKLESEEISKIEHYPRNQTGYE